MTKRTELRGRAVSFKLYKLDEATWNGIDEGGSFHPFGYVQPIDKPTRDPDVDLFGLLEGAEIAVGGKRKSLDPRKFIRSGQIVIDPHTLIIAQGFEGAIFEGEFTDPFTDIYQKLDSQEIVYPNGDRVRLFTLKAEGNGLEKSFFQSEATPLRARFVYSSDNVKDLDVWVNAQRMQFRSAIENSDKDTIWELIAEGFNPNAEYAGQSWSEIPQLFCKDVKTYKLLESLNALVMVQSDSTQTIEAIKAYAAGSLGLEVLCYIAEQDGSLNSDWNGNNGYLAIHTAVDTGDLEVVRAVVTAGADLHLASNDGETALGLALDQENPGLVTYLLSQGASLDQSDYRTVDLDGDDPEIDDPRNHVRSKEMEMLIKQFA